MLEDCLISSVPSCPSCGRPIQDYKYIPRKMEELTGYVQDEDYVYRCSCGAEGPISELKEGAD